MSTLCNSFAKKANNDIVDSVEKVEEVISLARKEKLTIRKHLEERIKSNDDSEDAGVVTCTTSNVLTKVMF